MTPQLSVIVVSWNTRELLRQCLASVRQHIEVAHEVIVVDNASSDGSAEMVSAEFPDVTVIRNDHNAGFGSANNTAMKIAHAPAFVLLNSDARLTDGGLVRLARRLVEDATIGVMGPRIRFEDGRLQASAQRSYSVGRLALEELGLYKLLSPRRRADVLLGGYWDHGQEKDVDWLVGACLVVRREVFERTGGFDPSIFLYGEEVEWCERIRAAGWRIVFSPDAEVIHVGHASAANLVGERGRIDLCLVAADTLMAKNDGRAAAVLGPALRMSGAMLRIFAFSLRRLVRNDDYGRSVVSYARTILGHYYRRATGRLRTPSPSRAMKSSG